MTTDDWRRASDARRGAVNRALDLDWSFVGVFGRGGGLQSRRLLSGAIFGGYDARLGSGARRVIGDAERLPAEGRIVYADRE